MIKTYYYLIILINIPNRNHQAGGVFVIESNSQSNFIVMSCPYGQGRIPSQTAIEIIDFHPMRSEDHVKFETHQLRIYILNTTTVKAKTTSSTPRSSDIHHTLMPVRVIPLLTKFDFTSTLYSRLNITAACIGTRSPQLLFVVVWQR